MAARANGEPGKSFDDVWSEAYPGVDFDALSSSPPSSPEGSSAPDHRPILLLVDEAQCAFSEGIELWNMLKGCQGAQKRYIRLLLVSSFGSDVARQIGSADWLRTPGNWEDGNAVVSLRPTPANRIAVQLTIKEAEELFDAWCRSTDFTFSSAVREHLFNLTDRQPGLLVAAFDWIEKMGLHNCSSVADMDAKVSELLLAPDFVVKCFASLRSLIRFKTILESENEGEKRCACELLRLLVCMTEVHKDFLEDIEGALALAHKLTRFGQLMEQDDRFGFPSRVHHMYFTQEFYSARSGSLQQLKSEGVEAFIVRVVERMRPDQLQSSLSRSASGSLYERHWQNEFYRAATTILPRNAALSPDAGRLLGISGYVDFLTALKWAFELLRDGIGLGAHVARFDVDGTYGPLIKARHVTDYAVIDFRTKNVRRAGQDKVYHVVFSDNYKLACVHSATRQYQVHVRGDASAE